MDAKYETTVVTPPREVTLAEKIVRALKWIIYIFIGLCLITAIAGKAYAKKIGSDNVKPFGILFFSLYTWDFYSDIMFCARLGDAEQWTLFIVSCLFIFIPWIMNMIQLFRAQKKWTQDKSVQEGVRGWLIDWSIILVVAVCVSGNSFGAIELANSNLFGMDLFSMGLNPRHLKQFQGKRIYSSVILENIPQLAVQIYFLSYLGAFDEATFVALLSSSISVILSVVDIWSAKRLVSVMDETKSAINTGGSGVNINKIEFLILSNQEIESKKQILLTKPRALAKAIAETLIVDQRTVEIYQLLASTHGVKIGFTVYAINYDCDKMIENLIKEKTKLQLLITNYWELKQFPDVSEFHKGTMTLAQSGLTSDGEVIEDEYSINNYVNQVRGHGLSVTSVSLDRKDHHIPLSRMKTKMKLKMKAMDPEMRRHTIDEGEVKALLGDTGDDLNTNSPNEQTMEFDFAFDLNEGKNKPNLEQYMARLHKYATYQTEIYESHPISKDEPLELVSDDDDDEIDSLWMQYTANIKQLLEKRSNLQQTEEKENEKNENEEDENNKLEAVEENDGDDESMVIENIKIDDTSTASNNIIEMVNQPSAVMNTPTIPSDQIDDILEENEANENTAFMD